jgi:hypothetical protein
MSYQQKEDYVLSWIKQIRRPDMGQPGGVLAADSEWLRDFPALHDYLTLGTDSSGAPRRVSTLTLFAEHGSWKVFLNERDVGASICATGDTVNAVLSSLEAMLEADNCPWRFSGPPKSEPPKKGRKGS